MELQYYIVVLQYYVIDRIGVTPLLHLRWKCVTAVILSRSQYCLWYLWYNT